MLKTRFTQQLEIEIPIVQAPIGGVSNPILTAAVSNAGGLGMLAGTWRTPDNLRDLIRAIRDLTAKPFGINFVLDFEIAEKLELCLQEKVPVISLFWGDAAPWVERIHHAGSIVMHTVGSALEASAAARSGVDVLVAQGIEAGGHVWGQTSSFALIPSVVDAVPNLPVIAAGGIADGRGLAALCLGASGVWLGTRFVASLEANAHPAYQQALLEANETDTVYAKRLFNLGWDFAAHRTLKNSTYRNWLEAGMPEPGSRPGEGDVIGTLENGVSVLRYGDDAPTKEVKTGTPEAQALYAGQSVGLVRDLQPAAQIVQNMAREAQEVLQGFGRS